MNLFCQLEQCIFGLRNSKASRLSKSLTFICKIISFTSQIYWLIVLCDKFFSVKPSDPHRLLFLTWINETFISMVIYVIVCFKYSNLCFILESVYNNIKNCEKSQFKRINWHLSVTWFCIDLMQVSATLINLRFESVKRGLQLGVEVF